MLTHDWLLPTHRVYICRIIWCMTCVNSLKPSVLNNIGWNNGLSSSRRQAILWNNGWIMFTGPLKTTFGEILIEIRAFSFTKTHLKMPYVKWRPFCHSLNALKLLCYDRFCSLWKSRVSVVNWNYPAAFYCQLASKFASQAPWCNESRFWWLVSPIKQQ